MYQNGKKQEINRLKLYNYGSDNVNKTIKISMNMEERWSKTSKMGQNIS